MAPPKYWDWSVRRITRLRESSGRAAPNRNSRAAASGAADAVVAPRGLGGLPSLSPLEDGNADGVRRGRGEGGGDARRRAARRPRGQRGSPLRRAGRTIARRGARGGR